MKRMNIAFAAFVAAAFLSGCGQESGPGDGTIVLDERVFIQQVTEITMEMDNFVGQTVRYEGLFGTISSSITGREHNWVIRLMVCCDPLGEPIGFFVDIGEREPFPNDTWVEVTGVLEAYLGFGFRVPQLEVIEIREVTPGNAHVW
ncbi:MAG: hypothetical protein FWG66_11815 [Spirochaetes bacterium]|nr:hypothetical protein [Spirochaetota bacterium]